MIGLGLSLNSARPAFGNGFKAGDTIVFSLLGQSNMVGRANFDGGALHPASVQQWGRSGSDDGQLVPATAPLQHHDPGAGHIGLDIDFAQAAFGVHPGVSIAFVPCASGGSGFAGNRWNPGDDLYADAVNRTNSLMAENPDFVFGGFLWHQGESDPGNLAYATDLDACIAGLRQDVVAADETTPFILGGLVPGWVAQEPERQAIQTAIEDTPNRMAHTAVCSSSDLVASAGNIHFNAADIRTLGVRYWLAWHAVFAGSSFQAPQPVGTIPDQSDHVTLAAPQTVGTIPDQTDSPSLAVPEIVGTIPNQEDALV